jgi:hypothetical protein
MRVWSVPVWGFLLLNGAHFLSGCTAIDGSIALRAGVINKTVENARNEAILLNIARASYSQPLNFVTINRIGGAGMVDLRAGLPQVTIGSNQTAQQRQVIFGGTPNSNTNILETQATGNFDVAVLDSKDFYKGLLTPVSTSEVNLLISQGFPRELLFYVLVESIRVSHTSTRTTFEFRNDPTDGRWSGLEGSSHCDLLLARAHPDGPSGFDPLFRSVAWSKEHERDCNFQKFRYFVRLAIRYGLTTETIRLRPQGAKSPITITRLCFDPAIAAPNRLRNVISQSSECGAAASQNSPRGLAFRFPNGIQLAFEVKLRSPFAIYRYLGRLLADGTTERVILHDEDGAVPGPHGSQKLLAITHEMGGSCFTEVLYSSKYYCVPMTGSEYTKQIFSLLGQLSALNTTAADLPVTSTVRVTP